LTIGGLVARNDARPARVRDDRFRVFVLTAHGFCPLRLRYRAISARANQHSESCFLIKREASAWRAGGYMSSEPRVLKQADVRTPVAERYMLVGCRRPVTVSYPRVPAPNRPLAHPPVAVIYNGARACRM
jgi:hypothetical protein